MLQASQRQFISLLKNGDIGLIYKPGIFAWAEGLRVKRFDEGNIEATHGFVFKDSNTISEANGFSVHPSPVTDYLKPGIKMWVFRFPAMTIDQRSLLNVYISATEQGDARYSWEGIWEMAKSVFTGQKTFPDPHGEFCSDYTGQVIKAAGLPYMQDLLPWEIDPTTQLQWFLYGAMSLGWVMVGSTIDGKTYQIQGGDKS